MLDNFHYSFKMTNRSKQFKLGKAHGHPNKNKTKADNQKLSANSVSPFSQSVHNVFVCLCMGGEGVRSGLVVAKRNWCLWLFGAVSRVGADVVVWTGTGGQGLLLDVVLRTGEKTGTGNQELGLLQVLDLGLYRGGMTT